MRFLRLRPTQGVRGLIRRRGSGGLGKIAAPARRPRAARAGSPAARRGLKPALAIDPGESRGRPSRACRKPRGETPAARWKVRTKLERSPKPTSKATSVIGRVVVGEQARGAAQARADQVLVRRHAEHLGEEPQEVEGAEPGLARRALEVDRLVRVRVDPERRLDRAAAVARAGAPGGCAPARRRPRRSGPRTHRPTSSSPTSLRPSAAAWASSPSTISSAAAARAPVRQTPSARRASRPAPARGGTTGTRRRRRDGRACRRTRRRDDRSGPSPPPARTARPGSGSRSCPCARRRERSSRAARRRARPGPGAAAVVVHRQEARPQDRIRGHRSESTHGDTARQTMLLGVELRVVPEDAVLVERDAPPEREVRARRAAARRRGRAARRGAGAPARAAPIARRERVAQALDAPGTARGRRSVQPRADEPAARRRFRASTRSK